MKAKDWLKILIFAVIITALTIGASFFLRVPEARDTTGMYGFYLEEENSLDVVLIGPSPVYTDFYSPLAYEQEGFTSYNVSVSGMCGETYPSAIRETLQTQDPQLFVVELSAFCYGTGEDYPALHRWLDSIRKGENRDQTIEELVPEEEKRSYQIPFYKYHSNWPNADLCLKSLTDQWAQKKRGYSVSKNSKMYTNIDQGEPEEYLYDYTEAGLKALEDFLAFLDENQIKNVLFVRFPYKAEIQDGDRYLEGIRMILEKGYDVLDYCGKTTNVHKEDLQLNFQKDFYDREHLTVFGTEKLTRNLAAYIDQNYVIQKDHSGQTKEQWDRSASFNTQIFDKAKRLTLEKTNQELYTQKDFLE